MKQLITVLLVLAILGGGVWWWSSQVAKQGNTPRGEVAAPAVKTDAPSAADKAGTTTRTGLLTTAAGKFYLQEAGQSPKEIDSYVVELSDYVGQTVTVSGQYSGDTLFVGSVE